MRMGDLFTHRWKATIKDDVGQPTREFMLWCEKLQNRTPEEIAEGFRLLERRVASDYDNGKESWPPSYAEFGALCKPYKFRQKPIEERIEHQASEEVKQENLAKLREMMKDL